MKTNRRTCKGWVGAALVVGTVALGVIGLALTPVSEALGQNPTAKGRATNRRATGKNRGNDPAAKKAAPNAADPLQDRNLDPAGARALAPGSYHYRLKIHAFDDVPLAASYYPARLETNSPVVLLVHEKDRSGKDFEDPITELKGEGLAHHLQGLGYAVVDFDLRGHGTNTRRAVTERDWRAMADDLQAVYQFLVDRHNRGELNLARFGVVAVGEGANLAAAWAYLPGGAVSNEGRVSDLGALALISPLSSGSGYNFTTLINSLAPRVPILLMAGERDAPSHDAVRRVRANVEKFRQNRVETFPSALHGYKLLRLEPRLTISLAKFLESTVKLKTNDWEPRYNLTPVSYTDIQVVRTPTSVEKEAEKAKEAAPQAKENEAPKAEAKDGANPAPKGVVK